MVSKKSNVVLHRLNKAACKLASTRVRYPWNKRAAARRKAKQSDLTPEHRKALKQARDDKKEDLRRALMEARDVIWGLAGDMATLFGGHSADYYFRLILQAVTDVKKAPRKITLWNAFISKELKRMNAGEHVPVCDILLHTLT